MYTFFFDMTVQVFVDGCSVCHIFSRQNEKWNWIFCVIRCFFLDSIRPVEFCVWCKSPLWNLETKIGLEIDNAHVVCTPSVNMGRDCIANLPVGNWKWKAPSKDGSSGWISDGIDHDLLVIGPEISALVFWLLPKVSCERAEAFVWNNERHALLWWASFWR